MSPDSGSLLLHNKLKATEIHTFSKPPQKNILWHSSDDAAKSGLQNKEVPRGGWNCKDKVSGCGKKMSINLMQNKMEQHSGSQFTAQSSKTHTVGLAQP